jgi:hypothetical protein
MGGKNTRIASDMGCCQRDIHVFASREIGLVLI